MPNYLAKPTKQAGYPNTLQSEILKNPNSHKKLQSSTVWPLIVYLVNSGLDINTEIERNNNRHFSTVPSINPMDYPTNHFRSANSCGTQNPTKTFLHFTLSRGHIPHTHSYGSRPPDIQPILLQTKYYIANRKRWHMHIPCLQKRGPKIINNYFTDNLSSTPKSPKYN